MRLNKKNFFQAFIVSLALAATSSFAQSVASSINESDLAKAMQADVGSTGAEGFTFEDGVVTSVRDEERAYLVLPQPYDNFELSLEYWIEPDTNSGIYVRCQDAEAISAGSCYEVNIWDANENPDNRTGSVVNFTPSLVAIDSLGQWTSMTIRAQGGQISVTVNGQTTADLNDETYSSGHIAMQYGGNNGLVKFRNLNVSAL